MNRQTGLSLVELLAVLALVGIGVGAASLYLRPMEAPLETAVTLVEGTLRSARLRAMATTSAYRVSPDGEAALAAEYAAGCAAISWTPDSRLDLELPRDVAMAATDWSVCFTARGVSSDNVVVELVHPDYGSRRIEVLLGGTTRVLR